MGRAPPIPVKLKTDGAAGDANSFGTKVFGVKIARTDRSFCGPDLRGREMNYRSENFSSQEQSGLYHYLFSLKAG
jgi:hypothetical protein